MHNIEYVYLYHDEDEGSSELTNLRKVLVKLGLKG